MATPGNVLVIGGGGCICRATAIGFIKEGATGILIADINLEAAEETVIECKKYAKNPTVKIMAHHVDVRLQKSVERLTAFMVEEFERIDYCVNGAAIEGQALQPVTDIRYEHFKEVQEVNTNGTFLVLKSVSDAMSTQIALPIDEQNPNRGVTRGNIVNIASVVSFKAMSGALSYVTSKHAVAGLTRNAALDDIQHSIRVNCICPSWIDTPMMRRVSEQTPGVYDVIKSQLPMGRLGTPEEIADAIIFLCSAKASWVNGSSMVVDGAMTIRL